VGKEVIMVREGGGGARRADDFAGRNRRVDKREREVSARGAREKKKSIEESSMKKDTKDVQRGTYRNEGARGTG